MSPFFLYYIIVAVWEYLFFLSSPIHNSAAVKAKAANWDALRCFATFTLRNRKFFSSKTSLSPFRMLRRETSRLVFFRSKTFEAYGFVCSNIFFRKKTNRDISYIYAAWQLILTPNFFKDILKKYRVCWYK